MQAKQDYLQGKQIVITEGRTSLCIKPFQLQSHQHEEEIVNEARFSAAGSGNRSNAGNGSVRYIGGKIVIAWRFILYGASLNINRELKRNAAQPGQRFTR